MILVVSQKMLPVIGEAEEGTVICRISVKSFMFPLLLLQVLSIAVQVKVALSLVRGSARPSVSIGCPRGYRNRFTICIPFLPSFSLSLH